MTVAIKKFLDPLLCSTYLNSSLGDRTTLKICYSTSCFVVDGPNILSLDLQILISFWKNSKEVIISSFFYST